MSPEVAAILEAKSLPDMLERIFALRFTGSVTFHFGQGRPNCADVTVTPARVKFENRRQVERRQQADRRQDAGQL